MDGPLRERVAAGAAWLRRLGRRERRAFRRWLEDTRNLIQLSVALFMPALLAAVTALSNAVQALPFLLFPPLASGTFTLFTQPESRYASPRRFVGGLTAGALCGWVSLVAVAQFWYDVPPGEFAVSPVAVAVGVSLTGAFTWLLDVEEPSAFSAALLVYVADVTRASAGTYVVGVFLSSSVVAAVFLLWRREFYEQRARYLYQSTSGDDRVLVPMRGERSERTAVLGARLAAAHEAGKVVLLDVVDDEAVAAAERELLDRAVSRRARAGLGDGSGGIEVPEEVAESEAVATSATRLEELADRIETRVGVPCEVVVAAMEGAPATTVLQAARETDCDLVAAPYEERHGALSPFVRSLFGSDVDVLVHRSVGERTTWKRVMVPVRKAGDVAHAMLDFALRLSGRTGTVSVCNCIESGRDRRRAEDMLADLVEPFDGPIETRVSRSSIESFLTAQAPEYDLVVIGASRDRSTASRLVSPPTFERLQTLDCDVAVVDRR